MIINKMTRVMTMMIVYLASVVWPAGADSSGPPAKASTNAKLPRNLAGLNGPSDLASEWTPEVSYYLQEEE